MDDIGAADLFQSNVFTCIGRSDDAMEDDQYESIATDGSQGPGPQRCMLRVHMT
jgi:hypothetical protein